jgi:ubiquinone/menaquinone biosynthesis C-methylase UbiE
MCGGREDVSLAREEDVIEDKVPFGYRRVTTDEKKRLVREQFDPIAPAYDRADALLSFGLDSRWRRKAIRLLDVPPAARLLNALYHLYSFYWMPFAGRLICGTGTSFRYLAESIRVFPAPDETAALVRRHGFIDVRFRRLTNGIAVVYLAAKPGGLRHPAKC